MNKSWNKYLGPANLLRSCLAMGQAKEYFASSLNHRMLHWTLKENQQYQHISYTTAQIEYFLVLFIANYNRPLCSGRKKKNSTEEWFSFWTVTCQLILKKSSGGRHISFSFINFYHGAFSPIHLPIKKL